MKLGSTMKTSNEEADLATTNVIPGGSKTMLRRKPRLPQRPSPSRVPQLFIFAFHLQGSLGLLLHGI